MRRGLAHFREKMVLDRAVGTTWYLPGGNGIYKEICGKKSIIYITTG